MGLKPRTIAILITTLGTVLLSAGAGLIYPPAGLITGGVLAIALGLFVIDAGGRRA